MSGRRVIRAAQNLTLLLVTVVATLGLLELVIRTFTDVTAPIGRRHPRVGKTYVNRSIVGAMVGVQPFGGEGISGTGPKAGGPNYLHRFAVERALSVNTSAVGGNATLLSLGGEE